MAPFKASAAYQHFSLTPRGAVALPHARQQAASTSHGREPHQALVHFVVQTHVKFGKALLLVWSACIREFPICHPVSK